MEEEWISWKWKEENSSSETYNVNVHTDPYFDVLTETNTEAKKRGRKELSMSVNVFILGDFHIVLRIIR